MITRPNRATSLATILFAAVVGSPLGAQETAPARTDSTHRFALFGGRSGVWSGGSGPESSGELGASGDLRWSPIPVPLRLSLSFSQGHTSYYMYQPQRGAKASLDLVMRPVPKTFGIQPYFLGGFGVATRAPYSGIGGGCYAALDLPCAPSYLYTRPRQTWAFASAGVGVDVGRLFMQMKFEQPVASQGPTLIPLSVGFRFWE